MSGYKPNFTIKEESKILQYIVKHNAYLRLREDAFWMEMEQAEIVDRSWQNLKQHFKKKLLYNLNCPSYGLTEEEVKKIKTALQTTECMFMQVNREKTVLDNLDM